MIELPSAVAGRDVLAALEEDAATCDLTTQWSVPDGLVSEATIISRAHGIIAGLQLVDLVMHHIDPSVSVKSYLADGDTAKPGDTLVQLHGPARSLITGERTAPKFLQRISASPRSPADSSPPWPTSASTSSRPAEPHPASERWISTRSGPVAAPTTA